METLSDRKLWLTSVATWLLYTNDMPLCAHNIKSYFHNANLYLIINFTIRMLCNINLYMFAAGQDISLVRTEPDDPQQLPCPHQRQEFQCQIMTPVLSLTWTLPNGDHLQYGALRSVGDLRISTDGNYIANLTQMTADSNDRFFYTSTLLVLEPVVEQNLSCTAVDESSQPRRSIATAVSGMNIFPTIMQ